MAKLHQIIRCPKCCLEILLTKAEAAKLIKNLYEEWPELSPSPSVGEGLRGDTEVATEGHIEGCVKRYRSD